jgi:hypothetical protein
MTCEVDFFKAGLDQTHMQVMQGLNELQIFSKQFTGRFKTASGHACSSGSGRKRIVEGGQQQEMLWSHHDPSPAKFGPV